MSEWEVVNIGISNSAWNVASAEIMAEYLGGEVQMAYADLGIESIEIRYWYVSISYNTVNTDIPVITFSGFPYAMLGVSSGGYYNTTVKFAFITIDTASTWVFGIGGGDGGCGGTWNVFEGDGFTALKQMNGSSCILVKDTANDLVNGSTVDAIIGNGTLIDIDNGLVVDSSVFNAQVIAQSDGRAFVEVVKALMVDSTSGSGSHVYEAEHVYKALFEYESSRDKNILINGIKFNQMLTTDYFIPLE